MKITSLQIDHFGAWEGLELPIEHAQRPLTVLYGANEAGKTTLMRFIRGTLFGFPTLGRLGPAFDRESQNWRGRLSVINDHRRYVIERAGEDGHVGTVTINEGKYATDDVLEDLLGETDRELYESIFAFGQQELAEFKTLKHEQIAQHLHGLSLGPLGRRLADFTQKIEDPRTAESEIHRIRELLERESELASRAKEGIGNRARQMSVEQEAQRLEIAVERLTRRRDDVRTQLEAAEYLFQVHDPWQRTRNLEAQLSSLPALNIPQDGQHQLDRLRKELAAAEREKMELVQQLETLRGDGHSQSQFTIAAEDHIEHRAQLMGLEQQLDDANSELADRHRELQQRIQNLGDGWDTHRVEQLATSGLHAEGNEEELLAAARVYKTALRKRSRGRKAFTRRTNSYNNRSAQFTSETRNLGGDLSAAIQASRERLANLEHVSRLRAEEQALESQQQSIRERLVEADTSQPIPGWISGVLAFFAIAGLIIAILGFTSEVETSMIAGAIYFLIGITGSAMAWGLRAHFESSSRDSAESLSEQLRAGDQELISLQAQIRQYLPPTAAMGGSLSDLIAAEAQYLASLEHLATEDDRLTKAKAGVRRSREKLRGIKGELEAAREDWQHQLRRNGLPENTRPSEIDAVWQQTAKAVEAYRLCEQARSNASGLRQQFDAVCGRLESLGHKLGEYDEDYSHPGTVLDRWQHKFAGRSTSALSEVASLEQQISEYTTLVSELRAQREVLLARADASSDSEFSSRLDGLQRRNEMGEQLREAQTELETLRKADPHLAWCEADLPTYSPEDGEHKIDSLQRELKKLERELHASIEKSGRVKAQLRTSEDLRRDSAMRFDQSLIRSELKSATEQLLARRAARSAVEKMRRDFERNHQPAVLAAASTIFERLTLGRYRNLWSPLGQENLYAEDETGVTYGTEQLSGGTREQLFLAIRIALVQELRREGTELPLVLDDITVNFDQARTNAVAETINDLAAEGQQVLFFTCHRHVVDAFRSLGISAGELPTREEHQRPGRRRAKLMAG